MHGDSFWSDRSVLVSGATGFLGSHLVEALVGRGARVAILRRGRSEVTAVSARWLDRVAVVEGEIVDTPTLERAFQELSVRTVMHLAALTQIGLARAQPAATFESNIRGTWSVLEAVRRSPVVGQLVVASSDKAYGVQPRLPYEESMPLLGDEPYEASKACAEMLARTYFASYGTPVAITRCANLYGPGDRNWRRLVPGTFRSVLAGERPVIRSDGSPVRDYLYVKDGVSGYLQLAEAMANDPSIVGEAFNFSAELPLTVREMVEAVQQAVGTSFEPLIGADAVGEIPAQYLSAVKARERLGWTPAHTLEQGLAETVAYYRELLPD